MGDRERLQDALKALDEAKVKLKDQDDYLASLENASNNLGTVIEIRGDRMTVAAQGLLDAALLPNAKVGDTISLVQPGNVPFKVIPTVGTSGVVAIVKDLAGNQAEVEIDGSVRAVKSAQAVQVGERVVIDATMTAIIASLGMPKPPMAFEPALTVSWDDIGGCESAKAELQEAIELPYKHAELYRRYGKRPAKGVLMYGPPGNGKTLLAKAAATAVARAHGKDRAEGFTYVAGPSLLSKWVGETEANIRNIFKESRKHFAKHGYPALVFIDEADSLLGSRSDDRLGITNLTVGQFLAEMDGLEETGALLILATNRPTALDPAVVREGRIDRKVRVDRPDQKAAASILGIHLRGKPVLEDGLAGWTAEDLFTQEHPVKPKLRLRDAVSGAMLAGLVDQASSRAMLRDAQAGTCTGIGREDMGWALVRAAEQLRDTDTHEVMASLAR